MKKEKISLEYPLKSTSLGTLWNAIGTSYGLAEWFADEVSVSGDLYEFLWDGYGDAATLLEKKTMEYIRFRWEYDEDTDCYLEMRILKDELSSALSLRVTLFVEPDDREDEVRMWNKHIDDLKRKMGV